ncbi:hypothetical protein [Fundidesulfovibrio terrae]|uniref:hypothetical protein n=1 Tax=Fundidesulfovibrio terrae TaxID=2922866 RepID=UPI001FB00081|nr:hypothetical protein [Fundidesulfovibrio terrae]
MREAAQAFLDGLREKIKSGQAKNETTLAFDALAPASPASPAPAPGEMRDGGNLFNFLPTYRYMG